MMNSRKILIAICIGCSVLSDHSCPGCCALSFVGIDSSGKTRFGFCWSTFLFKICVLYELDVSGGGDVTDVGLRRTS